MRRDLSTIAALAGFIWCASAQANLVSNGSFDSSAVTVPYQTLASGSTLDGWSIGGSGIDVINGYWTAYDGSQSIDLNGLDAGTISQTLTTTPGQQYQISFAMAGNCAGGPAEGPPIKTMDVLWGSSIVGSPTFDITGHTLTNMGWTVFTYDVTATSAATPISFDSTFTGYSEGPALDAISVMPIPEPIGMGMLAFISLLLHRRNKKVKHDENIFGTQR